MNVLVTGAGGFLGIHVVESLLAHGHKNIRCLIRDSAKSERIVEIARQYPDARIEISCGNLRSQRDCAQAVRGASLIFHLAAGMRGAAADLFADSVVASRNLLEAIVSRDDVPAENTRVIFVSSFGVYGVVPLGRGAQLNEETPLEAHPESRDTYSYSKLRQEQLFWDYQKGSGFQLVVVRPGVIYGPGGGQMSSRVGLQIGPLFFHLGGRNRLPLSFVDNCAEAIVIAGTHPDSAGQVYNIHDDELLTASRYLKQYKKSVKRLRSIRIPYGVTWCLAWLLEHYNRRSLGQLPSILTRYKVAALWGGNRFDNSKLHQAGWRQLVSTKDGIQQTFESFRIADGKTR